ncbi:MAG: proteasome-type protease [Paracoccaceae bacterium]|nr:proteasome-type protease [Paracoccaceae bacterium]MDE2912315.1 proteasome-type protease [Paracoccaceae bacterium]
MTYCVGMSLDRGLVFMADTRTSAGVDNVSTYRKLFSWEVPGERFLTMMTAGNLATTQSVISIIDEQIHAGDDSPSIVNAPSMFRVADRVGQTLRKTIRAHETGGEQEAQAFNASVVVGGQIRGEAPRMFMVYPEGNFVESALDTPFFQLGETKYGKPILVRAYTPEMSFEDAVKLLIVSFDSTIKSNLSVGLPLDLQIYAKDSFRNGRSLRIDDSDAYYRTISDGWSQAIQLAFDSLPDFTFPEV